MSHTKTITIFNNKGGVGKTTTVWNLGDQLARQKKNVLLIDFDPQCNLSIAVLGEQRFVDLLPQQNKPYGTCIRSFLQRFLQNTGGEELFLHKGGDQSASSLRVIAGDFWLNVYAEALNVGNDLLSGTGIAKFVVLNKLIKKANEEGVQGKPFDYVLLDLPPSFGALVRAALYVSDYFLVPCTSDTFSAYCVGLIGQMLPTFLSDWRMGLSRFKASNPAFTEYDSLGQPKFAGWIFNGFDRRGGNVVKADQVHQAQIIDAVRDKLVGSMAKESTNLGYDPIAHNLPADLCVGKTEDMNVLIQNSIWQSVPVGRLDKVQAMKSLTDKGAWSPEQRTLITSLRNAYDEMASNVIRTCV